MTQLKLTNEIIYVKEPFDEIVKELNYEYGGITLTETVDKIELKVWINTKYIISVKHY